MKPERLVGLALLVVAVAGLINSSMHYLAIAALIGAGADLVIWGGR